ALYRGAPFAAAVLRGSERGDAPSEAAGEFDRAALELRFRHARLVQFGFDGPAGCLRGFVALQHPHASSSSGGRSRAASSGVMPLMSHSRSSPLRCGATAWTGSPRVKRSYWSAVRLTSRTRVTPVRTLFLASFIPPTPFRPLSRVRAASASSGGPCAARA